MSLSHRSHGISTVEYWRGLATLFSQPGLFMLLLKKLVNFVSTVSLELQGVCESSRYHFKGNLFYFN